MRRQAGARCLGRRAGPVDVTGHGVSQGGSGGLAEMLDAVGLIYVAVSVHAAGFVDLGHDLSAAPEQNAVGEAEGAVDAHLTGLLRAGDVEPGASY